MRAICGGRVAQAMGRRSAPRVSRDGTSSPFCYGPRVVVRSVVAMAADGLQAKRALVTLAWLAFSLGCAAPQPPRTSNHPFVGPGLLLSNSPTWIEDMRPELEDGELTFEYSVVADNVGPVTYALLVGQATFEVRGVKATVECREHGKPPTGVVLLPPNTRLRADCTVRYAPQQTQKLAGSDVEGTLTLRVKAFGAAGGADSAPWRLPYALFAKDFE